MATHGRCQTGSNLAASTAPAKHGHSSRSSAVGRLSGSGASMAPRTSTAASSGGKRPNNEHWSSSHDRKAATPPRSAWSSCSMASAPPPEKSPSWCSNAISKKTTPNAKMSAEYALHDRSPDK